MIGDEIWLMERFVSIRLWLAKRGDAAGRCCDVALVAEEEGLDDGRNALLASCSDVSRASRLDAASILDSE